MLYLAVYKRVQRIWQLRMFGKTRLVRRMALRSGHTLSNSYIHVRTYAYTVYVKIEFQRVGSRGEKRRTKNVETVFEI